MFKRHLMSDFPVAHQGIEQVAVTSLQPSAFTATHVFSDSDSDSDSFRSDRELRLRLHFKMSASCLLSHFEASHFGRDRKPRLQKKSKPQGLLKRKGSSLSWPSYTGMRAPPVFRHLLNPPRIAQKCIHAKKIVSANIFPSTFRAKPAQWEAGHGNTRYMGGNSTRSERQQADGGWKTDWSSSQNAAGFLLLGLGGFAVSQALEPIA
jgi:hypothetical protein